MGRYAEVFAFREDTDQCQPRRSGITPMNVADQALAQLMRLAGREQPDFVAFKGGAPALATRFHAEEAAAAALPPAL